MNAALIAGVDEAGRGPLAGAVFAAAVILDPQHTISGLADSKSISEKKRNALFNQIQQSALAWAIASASAQEIDEINILQASLLAMKRAVEKLAITPNQILVDGLYLPKVNIAGQAVVKGDSLHACISAASILAKVARDEELYQLDKLYPQYGFAAHKGYPTKLHLEKIQQYGVLPIHRKTFAPIKQMLQQG
jgi:ribonuclease HII